MWILVPIIFIIAVWQYLRARNDVFKRLDVVGPKPTILLGNLLAFHKSKFSGDLIRKWTKEYGRVYGYMEGGTPVMVTSDPDILLEVFVKQFNHFHGRKIFPWQNDPDSSNNINMFLARGNRWKRLRQISNPTFTPLKLKQTYPIVLECVDELMHALDKKYDENLPFDIITLYQGFTLDSIGRTSFGVETSVFQNQEHILLKYCRQMMSGKHGLIASLIVFAAFLLPELRVLFRYLLNQVSKLGLSPNAIIERNLNELVEKRKRQPPALNTENRKDFIQLMLDAEIKEENTHSSDNGSDKRGSYKRLSSEEIVSQCLMFLLAGYETTSNTLAFVTYLLALNEDVQEKLYGELKGFQDIKDYETINKLTYLDMVINETLRLYPVGASAMNRLCMEERTVNNVYIPAGMNVMADVLTVHYNEDIWGPDAAKFNPERFSPSNNQKRHPMAFMPFGAGPRICIGMKFAMIEMKLALATIVTKYKFKTCKETQIPVKLIQPVISITPESGIVVLLEKRE